MVTCELQNEKKNKYLVEMLLEDMKEILKEIYHENVKINSNGILKYQDICGMMVSIIIIIQYLSRVGRRSVAQYTLKHIRLEWMEVNPLILKNSDLLNDLSNESPGDRSTVFFV